MEISEQEMFANLTCPAEMVLMDACARDAAVLRRHHSITSDHQLHQGLPRPKSIESEMRMLCAWFVIGIECTRGGGVDGDRSGELGTGGGGYDETSSGWLHSQRHAYNET